MSKNYRTSGVPSMSQSSHYTWIHYDKAKPAREPNRNGPVKLVKNKAKARKKKATMVNFMDELLEQIGGVAATENSHSEAESEPEIAEVVEDPTKTKKSKPASGTVSIATGSITIAKKKRGNRMVRLLEIELSQEQLIELGITD